MFDLVFRVTAIAVAALLSTFGHAANADPLASERRKALTSIGVRAKQLYASYSGIQAQADPAAYRFDAAVGVTRSKANNTLRNDVVMCAVRGELNGLQYLANDCILSEDPSVFGGTLNPHGDALLTAGTIDLKTVSSLAAEQRRHRP